jgi:hypothetical protein
MDFDLGNNRKLTISECKGKTKIHIREYYQDKKDNEWKPGKKGIALSIEEFKKLLEHVPQIEQHLKL